MLKLLILSFSLLLMTGCMPTLQKPKEEKTLEHKKDVNSVKVKKSTTQKRVKKESKKKTSQRRVKRTSKKEIKQAKKSLKQKEIAPLFQSVSSDKVVLLQKGPQKEKCPMCGMNLVKYYKTNHAAKYNGKNIQYCSLHCLTKHINEGAELENPMVVDVTSLKFTPVTEVFYVVGSDVAGTMSSISKYAFKSLSDAKKFQKKHGGKILDFYSAWQIAKKDFK